MVNITRGQIQNLPITDKIVEFFEHNSFIDGNVACLFTGKLLRNTSKLFP